MEIISLRIFFGLFLQACAEIDSIIRQKISPAFLFKNFRENCGLLHSDYAAPETNRRLFFSFDTEGKINSRNKR